MYAAAVGDEFESHQRRVKYGNPSQSSQARQARRLLITASLSANTQELKAHSVMCARRVRGVVNLKRQQHVITVSKTSVVLVIKTSQVHDQIWYCVIVMLL